MGHRWQKRLDKYGQPIPAAWVCPGCKIEFSSYIKPPASAKVFGRFTCEEFQVKEIYDE